MKKNNGIKTKLPLQGIIILGLLVFGTSAVIFGQTKTTAQYYPDKYHLAHRLTFGDSSRLVYTNNSACTNSDFSQGTWSNWWGCYGLWCADHTNQCRCTGGNSGIPIYNPACNNINMPWYNTPTGGHFAISNPGADGVVPIQRVFPGDAHSGRIGNYASGGSGGGYIDQATYTLTYDPANSFLIYRCAVVLMNPGDNTHNTDDKRPRFTFKIKDHATGVMMDPTCGYYDLRPNDNMTSWDSIHVGSNWLKYLDWVTIGIDLSGLSGITAGQQLDVEFLVHGCVYTAHTGWAYISAFCGAMQIQLDGCEGAGSVTLTGPPGFVDYLWQGPFCPTCTNPPPTYSGQTITINAAQGAVSGNTFNLTVTALNGCQVSNVQQVIGFTQIQSDFTHGSACQNQPVQFTDQSTVNQNSVVNWRWDFGDATGSLIGVQNPTHTFTSPGAYTVKLVSYSTEGCTDSILKTVSVGLLSTITINGPQTVCKGSSSAYSTEPGMSVYVWTVSPGGTIISGLGSDSIQVLWSTTGTKTVTVTYNSSGCLPPAPTSKVVTVLDVLTQPGSITGSHDVNTGQTGVTYSIPPISTASSYTWTLTPGAVISSGSNTNAITVDFPPTLQSGSIHVFASNSCGNSPASADFNVTMHKYGPKTIAGTAYTSANSNVTIPIKIAEFNQITGISLRLDYNPQWASFAGSNSINPNLAGLLISNMSVSSTLSRIMIAWSNSIPLTLADSSILINLTFHYIADTAYLAWNNTSNNSADSEYADEFGNYTVDNPTTSYYYDGFIKPGFGLSGVFSYNNSLSTALDSLWVVLKQNGNGIDSIRTDLSGQYNFVGKAPGTYTISARTRKTWGGVNSTDAVKIQRHFVGLEPLTVPVRLLAADVNLSNSINGADAIKVKRRYVGLDTAFARGDWTFAEPAGGDTIILSSTNVSQDFQGLCVGDVNGSYVPGTGAKSLSPPIMLSNDILYVQPGDTVDLKLKAEEVLELGGISLALNYPSDKICIQKVTSGQSNLMYNILKDQLRIAWSDLEPLIISKEEELLTIHIKVNNNFSVDDVAGFSLNTESELASPIGERLGTKQLSLPLLKHADALTKENTRELVSNLKIYPNPVSQQLTIEFLLNSECTVSSKFLDYLGQVVYKKSKSFDKGNQTMVLNLTMQASGSYILTLEFVSSEGTSIVIRKILKL